MTRTLLVPEGSWLKVSIRLARGKCRGGSWVDSDIEIPPLTHNDAVANAEFRHVTEIQTRRFNLDRITAVLNGAVDLRVRLNNYDPTGSSGERWHRPNDSSISVSVAASPPVNINRTFNLSEVRRDTKAFGKWYYYVNDINSKRSSFSAYGEGLVLEIKFESDGTELVGRCPDCILGDDKGAPDAQANNAKIQVHFPIVFKRAADADPRGNTIGIAGGRIQARVNLDFDLHGIAGEVPGLSSMLGRMIEDRSASVVQSLFGSSDYINYLDSALMRLVQTAIGGSYREVFYVDARVVGDALVVDFVGVPGR